MLISAVSSNSQILQPLNPVAVSRPSASASTNSSSASSAASASASSTSSQTSSSSATSKSQSSHGGGGGGASSSAASSIDELVSGYSDTVGGKHYSGSVEKSGNTYTASVSGLAGASASGSSEAAAENSLSERISVLA